MVSANTPEFQAVFNALETKTRAWYKVLASKSNADHRKNYEQYHKAAEAYDIARRQLG